MSKMGITNETWAYCHAVEINVKAKMDKENADSTIYAVYHFSSIELEVLRTRFKTVCLDSLQTGWERWGFTR